MYIGLDVHKKLSYYSMVDGEGTEVKRGRFPTTCEGLDEFASELPEGAKVAIEASLQMLNRLQRSWVLIAPMEQCRRDFGYFAYEYLDERGG